MTEMKLDLLIGFEIAGKYTRDVELLSSNFVAEEVFTKKLASKPYTYIGNVISVATKCIGDVEIGRSVREEYVETKTVTIPPVVRMLPLSDANSLLLEIHRRCWQNLIPKQTILCKFCAKDLIADIDLDRVELSQENKDILEGNREFKSILCELPVGFTLNEMVDSIKTESGRKEMEQYKDVSFNRLVFRIPTLDDAIKNEQYASVNIDFWRRIAVDCLIEIQSVKGKGDDADVMDIFPREKNMWLGLNLFKYLDSRDLRQIRTSLIEELPTMPFVYEDDCPCDQQRRIPFAMNASAFFSE